MVEVVHERPTDYLENNNLLEPQQADFSAGHSTPVTYFTHVYINDLKMLCSIPKLYADNTFVSMTDPNLTQPTNYMVGYMA